MSDSLQTIIDLHAAATPGPHQVEVIDDHSGRHDSKNWVITGLARERYGNNSVSFGEDERTARFVAAAFTDVPAMAARLQKAEQVLAYMENLIARSAVIPGDLALVAEDLREALTLDRAE
ncbi:hypothetical protein [Paenarthrobacter sp. YJN-5]|uniref:hypothetical protein n=1 Tax=Paenarthrobacter sp. YJN-5 TaxID=2735316 RepID=UPI0018785FDF|nr:hypothetical protein [Paenarthrobacter sp. YJN-5]QOT19646.1 hypothetical protein HMI59_23835 [Paenarthrobacter sp. YJN-5]